MKDNEYNGVNQIYVANEHMKEVKITATVKIITCNAEIPACSNTHNRNSGI